MTTTVQPFLMFEGKAEEAMTFYTSLFPDGCIVEIKRYGKEGPGPEGSVLHATFTVAGQTIQCIDSPGKHAFTFTPSLSFFVTVDNEAEIRRLAEALGKDGQFMMPLDNYGFSRMFAWVQDRFGVSWQISWV